MQNPFKQPEAHYQLAFQLPQNIAQHAELFFDDEAVSTGIFEGKKESDSWQVEVLFTESPDENNIRYRLNVIAEQFSIPIPRFTLRKLKAGDWMQSASTFPPLYIGRFFIHGSHVTTIPFGKIPVKVDAGAAFGSGEHATTSGCLMKYQKIAKKLGRKQLNILDMGCGSAILGMAAAKHNRTSRITAVDIDPVSVRVSAENIGMNRLKSQARAFGSNGYGNARLRHYGPYDIIFANILARPLMRFARDLNRHLAPGGVAILSGLLVAQEQMVLRAHQWQGLRLKARYVKDGWSTLVVG